MINPIEFPYLTKGRWYQFFIESDGVDHTITTGDLTGSLSGDFVKLPEGYQIIDTKYNINFIEDATAAVFSYSVKNYADGTQAFPIPGADKYEDLTAYVFAVYDPS